MAYKLKYFTILLFLVSTFILNAQERPNDLDVEMGEGEEEEIAEEKQIDPRIKLWYLSGFGAFQDSTKLDTLQDHFHFYNPIYKDNIYQYYLQGQYLPILFKAIFYQ